MYERTIVPKLIGGILGVLGLSFHLAAAGPIPNGGCTVLKRDDSMRSLLPPCWYQKAAALKITTLKKNMRYGNRGVDEEQTSSAWR